ncbi:hypothetical protein GCM10025868_35940 [Angustibacter aerolatus]|uniref:histidine kinase n=1 Tax=Angustibacter aerolatus TaxID=1162965 RepID=A0ABQ6JLY2_9ACTN|nr:hypothetical protein GCM10025868_35940 [Angustibacter aerolatus]
MRLEEIGTSDDRDQVREEARIALHQVERLTSVVDSLLARARRSHRSSNVPVDLRTVLAQMQDEWAPAFRERRRRLVVAPSEPVRVLATPSALSQVLATLVENSLQHGQGAATVTARRTGRSVVVEVTDEGPGVPREIGARVFERSVSSSGSTGLGLSLARDLAEADGGRLEPAAGDAAGVRAVPQRGGAAGDPVTGVRTSSAGPCTSCGCRTAGSRSGSPCRLLREHEGAIGPEPEQRAEHEADAVGAEVVGPGRAQVEHVVAERQAPEGDRHAGDVEADEQQELVAGGGAAAVPERPEPVAQPGDQRGQGRRDHLGGQRLVLERAAVAEAEPQQVERAEVDHERDGADRAELHHLAHDQVEGAAQPSHQRGGAVGHVVSCSDAVDRGRRVGHAGRAAAVRRLPSTVLGVPGCGLRAGGARTPWRAP